MLPKCTAMRQIGLPIQTKISLFFYGNVVFKKISARSDEGFSTILKSLKFSGNHCIERCVKVCFYYLKNPNHHYRQVRQFQILNATFIILRSLVVVIDQ